MLHGLGERWSSSALRWTCPHVHGRPENARTSSSHNPSSTAYGANEVRKLTPKGDTR